MALNFYLRRRMRDEKKNEKPKRGWDRGILVGMEMVDGVKQWSKKRVESQCIRKLKLNVTFKI